MAPMMQQTTAGSFGSSAIGEIFQNSAEENDFSEDYDSYKATCDEENIGIR